MSHGGVLTPLLLLVVPVTVSAQAPTRLTLQQCIDAAMLRHPRLAVADSEVRLQESRLAETRAATRLPRFDFTALTGPVTGVSGGPDDPALRSSFADLGPFVRADVSLIQPLYTFGRLAGQTGAARYAVEAAQQGRQRVASEIRREVQRSYFDLLLARELVEVFQDVAHRVADVRTRIQVSLAREDGQFTPIDSSRLEVLSSELEAQRVGWGQSAAVLLLTLRTALGFPADSDIDIADASLVAPPRYPVEKESAPALALARRPEAHQARAAGQALSSLVQSARGQLYPQFYVGGTLAYGYAPNRTNQRNPFVRDDFNYFQGGVALGVRYSLSLALDRAKLAEATAEQTRADSQTRLTDLLVEFEARKSMLGVEAAAEVAGIRLQGARNARSWLAAAESNFDMGVGETRDLAEAFQAYVRARAALFQAIRDELIAQAEADYATGGK